MITVLVAPEDFELDEAVLSGATYRHLFRARRLASGIRLRAVDGTGRARWGTVVRVAKSSAALALGEPAEANEPEYCLELVVAALRGERASWLVEKVTEIGVRRVHFVRCQRTPRKYGEASLERLRRIAASAVVQCHRARLPEVTGVHSWEELSGLLAASRDRYFLHPGNSSKKEFLGDRGGSSGVVAIGPEGGWSAAECEEFESLGCRAIDLGRRVLRAETAAIVAASRLLLPA